MVAWKITNFGGMIPRTESRNLPPEMAEEAINCDVSSGVVQGLPTPQLVEDFSAQSPQPQRAYRLPGPNAGDPDAWLPLPSPYSSVCRSPLANDTLHRVYWTNPPGSTSPGAWWSTYERIIGSGRGGAVPPTPTSAPVGLALGGTAGYPPNFRRYCYTYVNSAGIEGAASPLSDAAGATFKPSWIVYGMPTTAPAGVDHIRLYRTLYDNGGAVINGQPPKLYYVADIQFSELVSMNNNTGQSYQVNFSSSSHIIVGSPLLVLINDAAYTGNYYDQTLDTDLIDGKTFLPSPILTAGGIGTNAAYSLGFIAPAPNLIPTITPFLGTAGVPEISRSYVFTYIDIYGAESSPSEPTAIVTGPPDAIWLIHGLPTVPPTAPAGLNLPPVDHIRLYRTVTGASTGGEFLFVADISFVALVDADNNTGLGYVVNFADATETYVGSATIVIGGPNYTGNWLDQTLDDQITNNNPLPSASWNAPLANLDGLTALAGGMLVGFTGNTVHFCEPDQPHAWPAAYDQSLQYDIQALGVWQQSLMVLTKGFPSTGSGNSPSNFIFTTVHVPEPCISRGSMITDLMGVYYASQNGLVMLNYFGMQNQTLSSVIKNQWLTKYKADSIIACRHRAQYLAINSGDTGFLVDYSEKRMGFMDLAALAGATCIWNDEYSGDAYIMAGGKVYLWDSPTAAPMIYRWRSKQFYGTAPTSLGACQISLDPDVTTPQNPPVNPLNNADPTLVLPAGVNAVFNLYAGPDGGDLVMSQPLSEERMIFRLPSGFKAFDWQCEVVSCVGVRSIELASTMKELRGV